MPTAEHPKKSDLRLSPLAWLQARYLDSHSRNCTGKKHLPKLQVHI